MPDLFSWADSVPVWAEDLPGVWKNKKNNGYRVPHNACGILEWNQHQRDGAKILEGALESPALQPWVKGFLMPHQMKAVSHSLKRPASNVWAPPGSGKTLCGIVWLCAAGSKFKLVVTRAIARGTWREEIRKYTTLRTKLLTGQSAETFVPEPDTIYVTAWETLIHWGPVLTKMHPDSIVFDEIHCAKNPKRVFAVMSASGEKQWKSRENISANASELSKNSNRRLGLTATPIPNRPRDLWAQLDLVEPWQWGTFHQFGVRYCGGFEDTYGWKYDGLSNSDELNSRLKLVKHKTSQKAMAANLPPKRRQVVHLSQEEQNRPAGGFKREIQKASKMGNHEGLFELYLQEAATRKQKYVIERVTEAARCGQRVAVFTGRRKDSEEIADKVQKHFSKEGVTAQVWWAHGGLSTEKRDEIRGEYMSSNGAAVLIAPGDSMGESINLQKTDLALIVMLPWTPRQIRQWEGRFIRLGGDRPVLISYVIAEGTVDEDVTEVLLDKLPAVGAVAQDEMITEFEDSFSASEGDLLARIISATNA